MILSSAMSNDNLPPGITDRDIDAQFGDENIEIPEEEFDADEDEVEENLTNQEL